MVNGTEAYKCPSCGANMTFSTESQDFHCEYCGSHYARIQLDDPIHMQAEEISDEDKAFLESEREKFGNENRLYLCPTCGAAVITDSELTASAECVYCHSAIVLSGRLSGEYRPDKLIPFKKTRGEAIMQFNKWIGAKKFFLAKGFGSAESLSKIQGIYVPFWLSDCCVEGKLTADCFKTISTTRQGDYIYHTESKSIAVRDGSLVYRGVPADGLSRADDALMDSIEPFDYSELMDFAMPYLSGHSAQRYDVNKDQIFGRVQERVSASSEEMFKSSIVGYTRINVTSKEFRITNINTKLAMMPVWFLTFKYKEKMYYYAMNGQTGKFGGTLPINKVKLALFAFGIPFAVAAVAAFVLTVLGVM